MKFGDELEIRLVNPINGMHLYTEPFDVQKFETHSNFLAALETFKENADDAINDVISDIQADEAVSGLSDAQLTAAARNRGYTVKKIDVLTQSRPCGCAQ